MSADLLSLGVTPADIRKLCKNRPISPYENFETSARDLASGFRQKLDRQLSAGYTLGNFSIPSILPPVDWSAHNRSFSFHLHAWDAITYLLIGHSVYGDKRYFGAALAHAKSWVEQFQIKLLPHHTAGELDALVTPVMLHEWYDMAVGQRAYRIAYILDVLAGDPNSDDTLVDILWKSLRFHLALLNRDHFFRKHSNHGVFQALGHMAAARRFLPLSGMDGELALSRQRLNDTLDQHFTREGVHKEHSPAYHFMLLYTFINARRSNLFDNDDISDRIAKIEEAAHWMVKPDYYLATFGDTDPQNVDGNTYAAAIYRNEHTQYVVSGGEIGRPPQTGVQEFKEAGYAFARLFAQGIEQTPANASYLAQIAAFHSRVHKHADHLSFVWYDRGRNILSDPARYAYQGRTEAGSDLADQGFWYSDPKRIYVESTRAHNCVEIDGASYPRRRANTFGSALKYAGEQNGLVVTDCEAIHFRTVRHRRILILRPGRFLLVIDWLMDHTTRRDYRQWFSMAPEWVAERQSQNSILAQVLDHNGGQVVALEITSLIEDAEVSNVARGQTEPELLGWTSDKAFSLVPSPSFSVNRPGADSARFATLFTFGTRTDIDMARTRFNNSMRSGIVAFESGDCKHCLSIDASTADKVAVKYDGD